MSFGTVNMVFVFYYEMNKNQVPVTFVRGQPNNCWKLKKYYKRSLKYIVFSNLSKTTTEPVVGNPEEGPHPRPINRIGNVNDSTF